MAVTSLCSKCAALCCRYFALQIDTPKTAKQFDDIRWYLCHENVVVFIEDGEWYVGVLNKCKHLGADNLCGIYETRPNQCADYRCAWHLGLLGPRVDRRPLELGVLFQFEQERGRWRLAAYETRPGALLTEQTQFLIRLILTHKKTRHLALMPDVHLVPYGADVPVLYPIADGVYDYKPPPRGIPTKPYGQMKLWDGGVRELLMPKSPVT